MYIYIYISLFVYMHIYIYTHIYSLYICIYIYIYIDTYILREFFPPIFKLSRTVFFEEHLKILTFQPHATGLLGRLWHAEDSQAEHFGWVQRSDRTWVQWSNGRNLRVMEE